MRTRWYAAGVTAVLVLATLAVDPAGASAPPRAYVDPAVQSQLARDGVAEFLVQLAPGHVDPVAPAASRAGGYHALTRAARERRADLVATLTDRGIPHTAYWIADVVLVRGDHALLDELAARPDVARIEANRHWPIPEPEPAPAAVGWGVQDIRAPRVWADFGITGEGITVATVDTGSSSTIRRWSTSTGGPPPGATTTTGSTRPGSARNRSRATTTGSAPTAPG